MTHERLITTLYPVFIVNYKEIKSVTIGTRNLSPHVNTFWLQSLEKIYYSYLFNDVFGPNISSCSCRVILFFNMFSKYLR